MIQCKINLFRPPVRPFNLLLAILLLFTFAQKSIAGETSSVEWIPYSDGIFKDALQKNKLILLNLEAVWCHWCHVMEKETYSDNAVLGVLKTNFITVKTDQDSRPDLSARYQDYGWPATIILDGNGRELRKLAGYIEKERFLSILQEVVRSPEPLKMEGKVDVEVAKAAALAPEYKQKLIEKHNNSLDHESGGLRTVHRFIDGDTLEYSLLLAGRGNKSASDYVKTTLTSNLKLIDPAWGGVYQYSTKSGWDSPHFEKIMRSQTVNLQIYSLAYQLWNEEPHWKAASSIYLYLKNFLASPEGAFYTSQDADLKKGQHSKDYFSLADIERRKLGIPAIDKNIYSRENGLAISALVHFYSATGNEIVLKDAITAANWIKQNRALSDGGFSHGDNDHGGPYLSDNLATGEAFLNIYSATGDRLWLADARRAADFIIANFADRQGTQLAPGFFNHKKSAESPLSELKDLAENIRMTRWLIRLFHFTGDKKYEDVARTTMLYLATPAFGSGDINDSGILLADFEIGTAPLHITIVGHKDDPLAKELFGAGLKYFSTYKRLEWWDKREGPMPNPDVEYPQMAKSAAFICTNKRCSLPIFKADGVAETIKLLHKDLSENL